MKPGVSEWYGRVVVELRIHAEASELVVELPRDLDWGLYYDAAAASPGSPASEVRLSVPVAALLTLDDAEGDLRAFVRDQDAFFDVMHVACGFAPTPGERFDHATLDVRMSGDASIFYTFTDDHVNLQAIRLAP